MLIPVHAPGIRRFHPTQDVRDPRSERTGVSTLPKTFATPAQNGQETVFASLKNLVLPTQT